MTRTGIVAGLLTCLALSLLGCSGSSASPIASSSVPPKDLPQCSDIYKAGAEVTDAKFGLACVKNDQVVSPRPVKLECSDGRQLRYNDLAWGYVSEKMTLTPDDDPSKTPEEAVKACLAPGPGGRSPANNPANDGNG
jgi:hypothetical protein